MKKITGDEPAYPSEYYSGSDKSGYPIKYSPEGLTIRQQFAMAALTGICSYTQGYSELTHITKKAVQLADLLIEELNKEKE